MHASTHVFTFTLAFSLCLYRRPGFGRYARGVMRLSYLSVSSLLIGINRSDWLICSGPIDCKARFSNIRLSMCEPFCSSVSARVCALVIASTSELGLRVGADNALGRDWSQNPRSTGWTIIGRRATLLAHVSACAHHKLFALAHIKQTNKQKNKQALCPKGSVKAICVTRIIELGLLGPVSGQRNQADGVE